MSSQRVTSRAPLLAALCLALLCWLLPSGTPAGAASQAVDQPAGMGVPIRDLVDVQGVRENQLVGYGLVVGLNGTGDGTQAKFTIQSLANALKRMGVVVPASAIRVRNAAAVMVTANLPAFARPGARLDVIAGSIGDAKSLTGGMLLMTPLRAADGQVYALAQGPVSLGGGFSAQGGGSSVSKNHPTTGRIPSGALVERSVSIPLTGREFIDLQLRRPDFETSRRISDVLAERLNPELVSAVDPGKVRVIVPEPLRDRPMEFLTGLLETTVAPSLPARVVLNERTGTIVTGGDVRISAATITHGNLTVSITTSADVSQPAPFSEGETVVIPSGEVSTREEPAERLDIADGSRISDLVESLNKLGVTPRDMIAILEGLRASGALHAELVLI